MYKYLSGLILEVFRNFYRNSLYYDFWQYHDFR